MAAIGNLSDFLLLARLSPGKHTIRPFLISHVVGGTSVTILQNINLCLFPRAEQFEIGPKSASQHPRVIQMGKRWHSNLEQGPLRGKC